ncbi:MAG: DUF1343 domain-containing protein [Myxococcales bacterium]
MLRSAACCLLLLGVACREPAARRETVEHAPSHSLAHPAQAVTELASSLVEPRPAHAQEAGPTAIDKLGGSAIAEAVQRALARHELPGCVIAIGNHETLLYLQAFGERTAGEPMTLDTHFDLASLTKPVATASSVMALVEQGAVALDAPAWRYLSELKTAEKRAITVRELMLHVAGLPRVNALSRYEQGRAQAIRAIADEPLIATPGSRFEYSDLGYILLGELVARVSGVPLDEYARTRIFTPLGLRDTRFNPPLAEAQRSAPTEERDEKVIRGVVDDPRSYRLGGVAGHAGVFSTARDLTRFAQMLLRHGELDGVQVLHEDSVARLLEPRRAGAFKRSLGFDAESPYAHARGLLFSERAVGHGGYTGTSLWLDPEQDLFVLLLSNRVHVGPNGSIHPLTSSITDLALRALKAPPAGISTGIDVLEQSAFAELRGRNVAVLTHAAARDHEGVSTLDRLLGARGVDVKSVMTPEHGFDAKHEGHVHNDKLGELPVYSLFGKTRKPRPEMLQGIDTVVIDLVDVGTRFYTYMASVLSVMEACAEAHVEVMLLDRPNPIGGTRVEGPLSETAFQSFVNFHPLPLRHGMTAGELARFLVDARKLDVKLEVIRVAGWQRESWFGDTDLVWHAPSPNLGTKEQAMLYPAVALVEGTNLSVGRGTDHAFRVVGAPFIDGSALARRLASMSLVGVTVKATNFTPRVGPYAGTSVQGVRFDLVDPHLFSASQLGLALIDALSELNPTDWDKTRLEKLVAHRATLAALAQRKGFADIEASWRDELATFEQAREKVLLY